MPQGSSSSPGCLVKVINEVMKGLKQVAAYLDDVIVFASDPIAHIRTIRSLFERLREHNLKLSPSKARLGATELPGPLHVPGGLTPERRKGVRIDQYVDAHGSGAGPCINGWY